MSFNKRFLTKENIISNLFNIKKLLNADALITDAWSDNFISDLNPKHNEARKHLNEKTCCDSSLCFEKHQEYKLLNSLSETFIHLNMNPSWIDVSFTINKLNLKINEEDRGKFNTLIDISKKEILKYYDKKVM